MLITVERPSATPTSEPFGLFTFRAPEGVLWRKWRAVQSDIAADLREAANCKTDSAACSEAARRFTLMVDDVRGREGKARIETANRLVNTAIRYTRDLIQHGAIDVWSAPLASLSSGRGDCEDYAIAKYVLLREAGVPEQDLRVLLVRDRAVREDHAVLAVRLDGAWTVMDNRRSALSADSELQHFTPLVELDHSGVNMFASPYLTQRTQDSDKTVAPAADNVGKDSFANRHSRCRIAAATRHREHRVRQSGDHAQHEFRRGVPAGAHVRVRLPSALFTSIAQSPAPSRALLLLAMTAVNRTPDNISSTKCQRISGHVRSGTSCYASARF